MTAFLKEALSITILACLSLFACTNKQGAPASMFERIDNSGIVFNNEVEDQEINNSFLFRNFYNGGGVAIGDINNDGLADVFLTSNMGENKLYLNKGNFQFQDISQSAGLRQDSMWSTGVTMVDINNDGFLDIYVCNSGHMQTGHRKNQLYINNHALGFTESAAAYNLDISAYCTQASFFDYDLDGDLDCFIIANSPMPVNTLGYTNKRDLMAKDWPVEPFVRDGGDHLYRNDANKFTEVTKEAGIHGTLMSFGLGVSVSDVNNDGYPDVYVSNDSYERDYLYINQKNGTFSDQLEECMGQVSFSSMGADVADINNDGYPDIFTTDMLPEDDYRLKTLGAFDNIDVYRKKIELGFYHQFMKNCLQLNNRNNTFSEIANYSGVDATDWSWGALLFDADNDGYNDIYVCNGVTKDVTNLDFMNFFANDVIQKMVLTGKKDKVDEVLKNIPIKPMQNKMYRNNGDLRFSDVGKAWGLTDESFSNGAAYGDLDNDGDLDLIVNNENSKSFIYRNNTSSNSGNHYIGFRLTSTPQNLNAIGAKISVYAGSNMFYRELIPCRGFQSSMDYKQIIGLGKINSIDSVVITWPDLSTQLLDLHQVDTVYAVRQASQRTGVNTALIRQKTLLDSVPINFNKHQEDEYVDFYYERNIPAMLSREGPRAAAGDVNGDGLEDLYIGGTNGFPGQLYLQQQGSWRKSAQAIFNQFIEFEDAAVVFFDADNDKDLDLFVGAGGNNNPPYSRLMQNRLFRNDGKGNFSLDANALPKNGMNIAVVVPLDFDNDGDQDLFVGGRSVPRDYGADPNSSIYRNDGHGVFTDVTEQVAPSIAKLGMVTDAAWTTLFGGGRNQLVIVGEWMHPYVFEISNGQFKELPTSLKDLKGWWQTMAIADVNNDNLPDLILGNIGENFYLHPAPKEPVKLWMADVDNNGDIDKILTRWLDGKDKPVFLKNDIQDQVPSIKKSNLKHHDFALKSVQELFDPAALKKAVVKEFNFASSCIAYNRGNGRFDVQALPYRAQLSSVNAIYCADLNHDGRQDIITAGNRSGYLPQLEKLDASYGDVFLNSSNRFRWQSPIESGLRITGEVRDIQAVRGKSDTRLLFLRNNTYPIMYSYK